MGPFLALVAPLTVIWLAASSTTNNSQGCWLTQRLVPFDLEVVHYSDGGITSSRGLRTTRDRLPGEVLMSVDASDVITCDSILKRYPSIQQLAAAAATTSSKLTEEQILALGLLEMQRRNNNDNNKNEQDDYQSYAQTLPTHQFSVMTLPDSLQACLPRCYRDSGDASKRTAASLYDQIVVVCQCNANAPPPAFHDFLWAFSTVRSRSISADELPQNPLVAAAAAGTTTLMLLPAFDLLNHKNDVDVSLEYKNNDSDNRWQLTTRESYQKGDEVFLNYAERDNLKMLFTYGFCCEPPLPTDDDDEAFNINNNNIALFDLQDLLDASSAARPTVFYPSIVSRIEPQLQTAVGGNGNDTGEQRAMFSLDHNREPRDSMLQGLQMMEQVSSQLLSSSTTANNNKKDDETTTNQSSFRADLVNCLTDKRRDELAQGLTNIQSLDVEQGWEGVRKSIEILLQAEIELLG